MSTKKTKDYITFEQKSGFVLFTLESKCYLVKKIHSYADLESESLEIELIMDDIDSLKTIKVKAVVPANLIHDLLEWSQMERTDAVMIKVQGEDIEWHFIPEEQWKEIAEDMERNQKGSCEV